MSISSATPYLRAADLRAAPEKINAAVAPMRTPVGTGVRQERACRTAAPTGDFDMRSLILGAAVALAAAPALAVTDPVGDFLPTHNGVNATDIDIVAAEVFRLGVFGFGFAAELAGPTGTTPGASYVWGVDRGAGVAGLFAGVPPVGPGVTFDAVVVIRADGTGAVTAFNEVGPPTVTALDPIGIAVGGNFVAALVDYALLPSRGFALPDYRFNLWTRSGGGNAGIADLAQESGTFPAVPEPATWAMLVLGFGLIGAVIRRTPRRTLA
jgi:hypothetical protein